VPISRPACTIGASSGSVSGVLGSAVGISAGFSGLASVFLAEAESTGLVSF